LENRIIKERVALQPGVIVTDLAYSIKGSFWASWKFRDVTEGREGRKVLEGQWSWWFGLTLQARG
jgi:hypothetical protein